MKYEIRHCLLIAPVVVLTSGCRGQTEIYSDLASASASGIIEKGWLPDFLPRSSRSLEITTDVEFSVARGSFSFDRREYISFVSQLVPYEGERSPSVEDNMLIDALVQDGRHAWAYSSGATKWVFLCGKEQADCKFFVWQ